MPIYFFVVCVFFELPVRVSKIIHGGELVVIVVQRSTIEARALTELFCSFSAYK
jgi:hypothetical protein